MHSPSASATVSSKVVAAASRNDSKGLWDLSAKMNECLKKEKSEVGREEYKDQMDPQSQLTEMTRVARHLQSIVIQGRTENGALKAEIQKLEAEVRVLKSKISSRRRTDMPILPLQDLKLEETEARNRALELRLEGLLHELNFFHEKDKSRAQKLAEAQRAAVDAYNRVEQLEEEREDFLFKYETDIHSLQGRLDAALCQIETLKEELEHTVACQGPPNQETAPQAELMMDGSLSEQHDIGPDRGALIIAFLAFMGVVFAAAAISIFVKSPTEELKECPVTLPNEEFNFVAVPNVEFDFGAAAESPLPAVNVCMADDLPVNHLSLAWQHLLKWGQSGLFHAVDTLSAHNNWHQRLRHHHHHHWIHYQQIQQWAIPLGSDIGRDILEHLRDPSDFYPVQ